MGCTLEPAIQSCDFVQQQLSIDHNMDIHYQVKHRLYMPWTQG